MGEKVLQLKPAHLLLLIVLLNRGDCKSEKSSNKFSSIQGSDAIQVTRCNVVCFNRKDKKEPKGIIQITDNSSRILSSWNFINSGLLLEVKHQMLANQDGVKPVQRLGCQKECMMQPFEKHGKCPDSFDNVPIFVQACVSFCSNDRDCPSTEKCCIHSCGQTDFGQTCKPASGLLEEAHLPPIPINLRAKEKKRKNGVHLTWEMPPSDKKQLVLYVLEERHHLGRFYNEPLLGEWNPIHSCKKTSVNLKNVIKPGYFYQFRVASVSVNGTRGFSAESEGFKLTRRPKLQKPPKLRVEDVREKNGTIWGIVRWAQAEAPIPIQKYKILWSHRLDVRDLSYKSENVLVQRDTVPEHQLFYQLKNLKKNTDYFIQVQALACYGRNWLKSKMAKMLFRTSKLENQFEMSEFD